MARERQNPSGANMRRRDPTFELEWLTGILTSLRVPNQDPPISRDRHHLSAICAESRSKHVRKMLSRLHERLAGVGIPHLGRPLEGRGEHPLPIGTETS